MPFCTQCGTQVAGEAAFCQSCGSRQPGAPSGRGERKMPVDEWMQGLTPAMAGFICYIPFGGWVAALVILATQRFREDRLVRFHAFQGLYLFVIWMLADIAVGVFFGFAGVVARRAITGTLKLSVVAAWVYMLVKTAAGEAIRLPFLGELADRSVAEQSAPRP